MSKCRPVAPGSNENSPRTLPAPRPALRDGRRSAVAAFALSIVLLASLLPAGFLRARQAGAQAAASAPLAPRDAEIVENGGYPELRVDGSPFFIHSAAFSYYRVPRDLWEKSLARYRSLGINTIDISIPWNWHEPAEGEFDFDGHSNPRRDLRGLLRLIAQDGFRLIACPGPLIGNDWRHGGYPDWLLARPEYKMSLADRIEGRYPPLAETNLTDGEAAAQGWLENGTHMEYTRKWLGAVAQELAPYAIFRAGERGPENAGQTSGSLLFIQLDDNPAPGRSNYAGPAVWRYLGALRGMLKENGLGVPVFINTTDMRVPAAGAGPGASAPIGAAGEWHMPPRDETAGENRLDDEDATGLAFLAGELGTQPSFPPLLSDYNAGWPTAADEDRPIPSPPENTLLSSRLLIANGIHGFNYFPLQDSFTPAGYSAPWASRSYRWDGAIGPDGELRPGAQAVTRNADLLAQWGPQLAASHKRADFGILDPLGAMPQAKLAGADILGISDAILRIEFAGQLAHLSSEVLDPEYQPTEQLLRDAVLILPLSGQQDQRLELSENAQRKIADYVQRGGTLLVFPERAAGPAFEEIWKTPGEEQEVPGAPRVREWKLGAGRVLLTEQDFLSWADPRRSFSENMERPEFFPAAALLHGVLRIAGVQPVVTFPSGYDDTEELVISELVSNEGTGLLGERKEGQGLLSITNLSRDQAVEKIVRVLAPSASARGEVRNAYALQLNLPPRESLLLPLEIPLCSAPGDGMLAQPLQGGVRCRDQITAAGAELLGAERQGNTLALTFYAPGRAEIALQLDRPPSGATLQEMRTESQWDPKAKTLSVSLPRGASPGFRRVLKLKLPYAPHLPEKAKKKPPSLNDIEFSVSNEIRLPLGDSFSLEAVPPLIPMGPDGRSEILLEAFSPASERGHEPGVRARNPEVVSSDNGTDFRHAQDTTGRPIDDDLALRDVNTNAGPGRDLSIHVDGDLRGSGSIVMPPGEPGARRIQLKRVSEISPAHGSPPAADGLLHATMEIKEGREEKEIPLAFLPLPEESPARYRYDFDRDGVDEWVLESKQLRLVVSPESGGQALALVEKQGGRDAIAGAGAFLDVFSPAPNPANAAPAENGSARGSPRLQRRLSNRPYKAEWAGTAEESKLHMSYEAPDIFPQGARIEKTLWLEGSDAVVARYRLELPGAGGGQETGENAVPAQSLAVVNSVPAMARGDQKTRFCWQAVSTPGAAGGGPAKNPAGGTTGEAAGEAVREDAVREGDQEPPPECHDFVPGGAPLVLPESAARLEVQTPGRPDVSIEWETGVPDSDNAGRAVSPGSARMVVEPKRFSALLRLEFPPLVPGSGLKTYTLRLRVRSPEP